MLFGDPAFDEKECRSRGLSYGAPLRVEKRPWPRTKTLVAATSAALHERMLDELKAGLVLTGQALPGPIPAESAEEIS